MVRNLARGTVVGSWLDEANAVTASLPHQLGLGGPSYEEAVAYNRATDRAVDRDSTKLGTLPVIGDVTAGGATKLLGGVGSIVATPMLAPFRGNALLPTVGNAATTGAAYGTLYGYGEGSGLAERGQNAAIGGGVGGLFGLGLPLAASGVAGTVQAARNIPSALTRKPLGVRQADGSLREAHPTAVKNIAQGFRDDFGGDVGNALARRKQLGPEAMTADLGSNLRAHAGAIASIPGKGKTTIGKALGRRKETAKDRIGAETQCCARPPCQRQRDAGCCCRRGKEGCKAAL